MKIYLTDQANHFPELLFAIITMLALSACTESPAPDTSAPSAAPTYVANVTPRPTVAPSHPFGQIPACPEINQPLFNTLPMALKDFLAFRPLGFTSPPIHVFPAKHSNFTLALPGETPPKKPVYFPGDVWLTEINTTEYGGLNKTGYGITFYPCREFKSYLGHLPSLSEKANSVSRTACRVSLTAKRQKAIGEMPYAISEPLSAV